MGDAGDRQRALAAMMAAYQGGDEMAFERLYGELAGPLRGYRGSLTHDAVRAEDLLQETFFQVHRARHTCDPERSVAAWIFAIARNVFLMDRRAARRRERLSPATPDDPPEIPVPPEAEGLADRDLVRRALRRLPEARREAVCLHHVMGLSFREVGAVQGVSALAAKLRAHRGMADLRELLRGRRDWA